MQDERSYRTQRRLLVLGMCLGYLGCLLALWYIWNAPRQWWFDTFWLHIAANRFTLILIPLIIFCTCYFKLLCISGDMLKFKSRQLDERQRMVRDSAHRTAYKIVTLLCLLIPLYLAAQGLFARPQATSTSSPGYFTIVRPVIQYRGFVTIVPGNPRSPVPLAIENGLMKAWLTTVSQSSQVLYTLDLPSVVYPRVQPHPAAPTITPLYSGIYYSLVMLTLLIIVCTLPKAIVAWKER